MESLKYPKEMPLPHLTRFYRGVNPRVEWNTDKTGIIKRDQHEEESWIALFIDLVYVAMFINVGHVLNACGSNYQTASASFAIFLVMFISRFSIDEYANRFFGDDIFHRIVYYVYTFGVFIMTLNIVSEDFEKSDHRRLEVAHSDLGNCEVRDDYATGFAAGFIITRASLVMLYAMISLYDKKAARQCWVYILRHGTSLVAMMALLIRNKTDFIDYVTTVCVIEAFFAIVLPFMLRYTWVQNFVHYEYNYPIDIYETQSRLGIFVMTVLGESIITLLTQSFDSDHTTDTYMFQS